MFRFRIRLVRTAFFTTTAFVSACFASVALAQSYRIERIASGLAQPTFMTQAPGDPANIIYYSTAHGGGQTAAAAVSARSITWGAFFVMT